MRMLPNTDQAARKIARQLDDAVSPAVALRLQQSRARALAVGAQGARARPAPVLVWAGLRPQALAFLAALLLLAAAWTLQPGWGQTDEVAENDAALLADELPLAVFTDKRFAPLWGETAAP